MPCYQIKYALSGGFGGVKNQEWETIEAASLREAQDEAYRLAIEEYDSMAGLHGLPSVSSIMEEDGLSESEAEEQYREERESWLEYVAQEDDANDRVNINV